MDKAPLGWWQEFAIFFHGIAAFASIGGALLYLGMTPPSERIASDRAIVAAGNLMGTFLMCWGMWRNAALQSTEKETRRQRIGAIIYGCYTTAIVLSLAIKSPM